MTSINGYGYSRKEPTSKDSLGSLSPLESSYDEAPVDFLAIGSFKPPIAKYIEEDLQKVLKMVLEVRACLSDRPHEKLLKARLPDVYCGKFHMECYNFSQ